MIHLPLLNPYILILEMYMWKDLLPVGEGRLLLPVEKY
jgi:hypothetical protein